MEDFLRCLMSEGVHAVHCAPRLLWLCDGDGDGDGVGVFLQLGSRGTRSGLEEASLLFLKVACH